MVSARVSDNEDIKSCRGMLSYEAFWWSPFNLATCSILYPLEGSFAKFVVAICDLPLSSELFLPGASGGVLYNGQMPNTRVLVLRLDFTNCSQ